MKLTIARERVQDAWNEAQPLLERGLRAFDPRPDEPLDVDLEAYVRLEKVGFVRLYTARREGELVGYALFTISPSLRRAELNAAQDILHTVERGAAWIAKALIEHSERELRAEGVNVVYHSSPMGARFARLLEVEGYEPIAQVHAKILN